MGIEELARKPNTAPRDCFGMKPSPADAITSEVQRIAALQSAADILALYQRNQVLRRSVRAPPSPPHARPNFFSKLDERRIDLKLQHGSAGRCAAMRRRAPVKHRDIRMYDLMLLSC